MYSYSLQKARDEDLQPDEDQDRTAQDPRLSRKARTGLLADKDAEQADDEGHDADHSRRNGGRKELIFGNGKTDRKRVDRGRDPLDDKPPQTEARLLLIAALVLDAVVEHFAADVREQDQGDPGNEALKGSEIL